jgi:UDPglucose 6-dehydrogenase
MPEFLAEGQAIDNLTKPERIVIGTADTPQGYQVFEQLKGLFQTSISQFGSKVIHTCQASSELGKLTSNAMLA